MELIALSPLTLTERNRLWGRKKNFVILMQQFGILGDFSQVRGQRGGPCYRRRARGDSWVEPAGGAGGNRNQRVYGWERKEGGQEDLPRFVSIKATLPAQNLLIRDLGFTKVLRRTEMASR